MGAISFLLGSKIGRIGLLLGLIALAVIGIRWDAANDALRKDRAERRIRNLQTQGDMADANADFRRDGGAGKRLRDAKF